MLATAVIEGTPSAGTHKGEVCAADLDIPEAAGAGTDGAPTGLRVDAGAQLRELSLRTCSRCAPRNRLGRQASDRRVETERPHGDGGREGAEEESEAGQSSKPKAKQTTAVGSNCRYSYTGDIRA